MKCGACRYHICCECVITKSQGHVAKRRGLFNGEAASSFSPPGLNMQDGRGEPKLKAPTSLAELQENLVSSMTHQTSTLQNSIGQLQHQVKQINEAVDKNTQDIASHTELLTGHAKSIKDLQQEMKTMKSRSRSMDDISNDIKKEAWIGGFPSMDGHALANRARSIIGSPTVLVDVVIKSQVTTGAIIKFDTPENMREFVSACARQGLPGNIFTRANRPPRTPDQKSRGALINNAWNQLVQAGMPKESLRANPHKGCVWIVDDSGCAATVVEIINGALEWKANAPPGMRNE